MLAANDDDAEGGKGDLRARHKFRYGEREMRESGAEARSVGCYIPSLNPPPPRSPITDLWSCPFGRSRPSSVRVRVSGGGANDIDAAYFGEKTDG